MVGALQPYFKSGRSGSTTFKILGPTRGRSGTTFGRYGTTFGRYGSTSSGTVFLPGVDPVQLLVDPVQLLVDTVQLLVDLVQLGRLFLLKSGRSGPTIF